MNSDGIHLKFQMIIVNSDKIINHSDEMAIPNRP
jgi:hypothetical protein